MMMRVIVLCLIFSQYASSYSPDYDDILRHIFDRSFRHRNSGYSDYTSNGDCCYYHPCQNFLNDYDIENDPGVEVLYADPEQIDNIYNFLMHRINAPSTSTINYYDQNTGEVTTQKVITPEIITKNTEVEYRPTTPTSEEPTTIKKHEETDYDYPEPVEDIINQSPEVPSQKRIENWEEYGSTTTSSNIGENWTNPPIEEDNEQEEYNDDYRMRDSEEDRLSVKKVEDDLKHQDADEEDNNSEPDDVMSWLSK